MIMTKLSAHLAMMAPAASARTERGWALTWSRLNMAMACRPRPDSVKVLA
jgi:hypothetical protein